MNYRWVYTPGSLVTPEEAARSPENLDMPKRYTIVQHSAAGYKRDPDFEHGLEVRTINTRAHATAVAKAGGRVFDSFVEASNYCYVEMYPSTVKGLIPEAPGTFPGPKVDGLKVYRPLAPSEPGSNNVTEN